MQRLGGPDEHHASVPSSFGRRIRQRRPGRARRSARKDVTTRPQARQRRRSTAEKQRPQVTVQRGRGPCTPGAPAAVAAAEAAPPAPRTCRGDVRSQS